MNNTLKNNKYGIIMMICSSICACLGQLFWKLSTQGNDVFLLIGFFLYGIGALIMIVAYRFGELSILQPILSLNYILTLVLAYFVLHEDIDFIKCIGIITIMFGVVMISRGEKR